MNCMPTDLTRAVPISREGQPTSRYVFRVTNGRELQTAAQLRSDGHAAIVPVSLRHRKIRWYMKRKRMMRQPVMPGYVLVALQPLGVGMGWYDVLGHKDVRGVLGTGGFPVPVSEYEFGRLFAHRGVQSDDDEDWSQLSPPETASEVAVGDEVAIDRAGFEWGRARVLAIHGREAKVVLSMFGSEREASVCVDQLLQ